MNRKPNRVRWLVALAISAAGFIFLVMAYQMSKPGRPKSSPVADPWADLMDENPGYVGPKVCAQCHAERTADFMQTRHYKACCETSNAVMPPGFEPGHGDMYFEPARTRFSNQRLGAEYVQQVIPDAPRDPRRRDAPIALIYGSSGKADEIYYYWRGNALFELPVAWLSPTRQWGVEPVNQFGDRPTTPRCLECHNTWFDHVPGTLNEYRRDNYILGVTCERCHGPGREHVEFHSANPDRRPGAFILRPAQLTRDQRTDLCAQCHSNYTRRKGPAFSYRAGEPLDAHLRYEHVPHREGDHVADQVKYLRRSKCYQKSDSLTCVSCHSPHRPMEAAEVRRSCQKCHEPNRCTDRERQPEAVRGNCVGCHMPQFTRIQVNFHTETALYQPVVRPYEHAIGVYPFARDEVLMNWHRGQAGESNRKEADRLQDKLVEYWLDEANRFRREHRYVAAIGATWDALRIHPSPRAKAVQQQVVALQMSFDDCVFQGSELLSTNQLPAALSYFERALRLVPNSALVHGKLGTTLAALNRMDEALDHLRQAERLDPEADYAPAMLGWLALLGNRPQQAVEYYQKADNIQPNMAKTKFHLGLAYRKLGRNADAVTAWKNTLQIDPAHAEACRELTAVLGEARQWNEAIPLLERAARFTRHRNPGILTALGDCYFGAGRVDEAEAALRQALEAAGSSAEATQGIRRRLADIGAFRAKKPNG